MDPITVMAVIMAVDVAAQEAKGFMQYQSANAREASLDKQMKEDRLQYQEKTIANYDQMQRVLEMQQAQMAARGVSMDSPSFKAVSGDTFNIGSKAQSNLDLEERIRQTNFKIEKDNVRKTLYAQLFGDASTAAKDVAEVYAKS